MLSILAITLPIYLLIATGFVAVKSGYVAPEDIRALGRVVMRICLPATIFINIARVPVTEVFRWDFLLGYLAASLIVFGMGFVAAHRVYGWSNPSAALVGMGMACSNSAFMGYPIAAMVMGDVALQAFTMAMLVENMLLIPIAIMLADRGQGGGSFLRETLLPLVRNPLLIAVLAAVAVSSLGLVLPAAVDRTLSMLAPVAPPVALLAVGGTVAALAFTPGRKPVLAIVGVKLMVLPLVMFGVLHLIGSVPQPLVLSGVLISSVPMMSIYALFGQRWGEETIAASALILATAVSFLTVSALLWLGSSAFGQG